MDSNNAKKPSVGKNFATDQRAIKVFRDWIPDTWLPREMSPDFFIDFLVETVESGEPTGIQFGVQIKGTASSKKNSKRVFSFKTKHLRYYIECCQQPVFLLFIDVNSRQGWWLFAQKHIRECLHPDALRQSKVSLRFPDADNLTAKERFAHSLKEAFKYVRDLHPGSIEAALLKQKKEFESKDPRLSVSISVEDGKQKVTIQPKESFTFTTNFLVKDSGQEVAIRNFYERGAELKLKPGEFEVSGAPLMEELVKEGTGGITIKMEQRLPACVQMILDSRQPADVIQFDGNLGGGTKYAIFSGRMAETPLTLTYEIAIGGGSADANHTWKLHFSFDGWIGQGVRLLAHFEQVDALIQELVGGRGPRAKVFMRGNLFFDGRLTNFNPEGFHPIANALEWVRKCRWIAQHFKINPRLIPFNKISPEQWGTVEDVYDLLHSKEVVQAAPNIRISGTVQEAPSESVSKEPDPDQCTSFRLDKASENFDILGHPVSLGPVRFVFTAMRLSSSRPNPNGETEIVLDGAPASKQMLSLLT